MSNPDDMLSLKQRIEALEIENALLRRDFGSIAKGKMVTVPEEVEPLFDAAQDKVSEYFRDLKMDPTKGTIEINEQRYVLVRASALSKDFLDTIQNLYADRGPAEAITIGKNFLFDISHVIGMNDARVFHKKMNFTDPLSKLSAGPIHFAYSGWAFVEILPESNPSPDDNFCLLYNHPYSFEADSWVRSGKRSDTPVCIMNAGYSSGWCEESFGIPLTSVEVSCIAKGDSHCTFIMSPPHKIEEHLAHFHKGHTTGIANGKGYEIPTFFERKKVEEEMQRARILAEESVKTKSDFVANMSHELRTPLGAILGFTDLLRKTDLNKVQEDYLEAIHSSGNNLLSIINDILDLSKLDAGRFAIDSIPFSLPELIHSVEVMFSARAADKGLVFSCYTDPAIDTNVIGDPMRLTQILTNLIGNAIKFTEAGSVSMSCLIESIEENGLKLHFTVKDTGIGIPEEKREHIFERFTQADTDITRKYGGTGLGLAITRQLVALQGGSIWLEAGQEAGVAFHFTLEYDRVEDDKEINHQAASFFLDSGMHGKKILIAEDNLMNQKLTDIILRNNGFETTIAANGSIAVELLREHKFDLILMDIQMPVMDGYKATCAIRDDLHIATPIIAMTAHALDGERENCIHKGMDDYISKPFKEDTLLQRIAYWLSRDTDRELKVKTPVIDLAFLRQQTRGNRTFILEMISIFREENPKDVERLQAAIDKEDYMSIYKAAHTLRNTTGFFGLHKLIGGQLLKIEQHAHAKEEMAIIRALFPEVRDVFQKAVEELENPNTLDFI